MRSPRARLSRSRGPGPGRRLLVPRRRPGPPRRGDDTLFLFTESTLGFWRGFAGPLPRPASRGLAPWPRTVGVRSERACRGRCPGAARGASGRDARRPDEPEADNHGEHAEERSRVAAWRSKHCFLHRLASATARVRPGLLGIVARAAWDRDSAWPQGTRAFYPGAIRTDYPGAIRTEVLRRCVTRSAGARRSPRELPAQAGTRAWSPPRARRDDHGRAMPGARPRPS